MSATTDIPHSIFLTSLVVHAGFNDDQATLSHRAFAAHRTWQIKEIDLKYSLAVFIATAAASFAPAHADGTLSPADQKFVAMVSQGGMFEVAAADLAVDQGNTQDLKDQGTTESHDHKLVGAKLMSIAKTNGLKVADSLNPQFQKELDDLKAKSGVAFDTAYLKDMAEIHAKDGAAFATEAKGGSNADLKEFAAETHRIVVRHIGEIKASGPKTT